MKILVIGAGAWGTALAIHFARHGHELVLWTRSPVQMQAMRVERCNSGYLKDFTFPDSLTVSGGDEIPERPDLVLIATPVSGLCDSLYRVRNWGWQDVPTVTACKGFDPDSLLLPHQTVRRILGGSARTALLSGPSFAKELASRLPCAVTLAADDAAWAEELVAQLNTPVMRLYSNDDMVGVAVGGAVKNIMAIATGIADGLEYGMNARAALMTRGLAETRRLASALGARESTLLGLSGVGDLILTCTGTLSRNRTVGLQLAQGKSLAQILDELGHVAEGVHAVRAAAELARRHQVEMPVADVLRTLFDGEIHIREVAERLMDRKTRSECV